MEVIKNIHTYVYKHTNISLLCMPSSSVSIRNIFFLLPDVSFANSMNLCINLV